MYMYIMYNFIHIYKFKCFYYVLLVYVRIHILFFLTGLSILPINIMYVCLTKISQKQFIIKIIILF